MAPLPVLAIAFVNPALLGGVGLAAVPIIIHWLSRRYYRRMSWAATRFLLEAERETRRRTRFEQWLLLALRCLAMALLALLVARPYARPGLVASLLGGRGQVQRVIVLDDSASLSYRSGPVSELARLKEATARLLAWLHQEAPRDPISFYLTSAPAEPLLASAVLSEPELAELRERVRRVEPVVMPAHPQGVFQQIATQLGARADMDVYVFSDFQRTDWLAAGRTTARADPGAPGRGSPGPSVFEPLRRLGAGEPGSGSGEPARRVRAVLVASGVQPRDNVGLTGLRLERPQTVAGLPVVIRAELVNFGTRAIQAAVLQVAIDGAPQPAVPVDGLDAGAVREVAFETTFPEDGYHVLSVALEPIDSFRVDDTRYAAVAVKSTVAVLVANGAPAADPYADEVFLLRSALAPPGPLSSGLRADVIDADELTGVELSAYDAVFLCNVAPPREAAIGALQACVQHGGGLVFFLGSEVGDPGEYNRAWFRDGAGLLPLPLERLVVPSGRPAGVGLFRTQAHPVTGMFPADAEALSEYVHFWRYYRCAEPAGSGADLGGDARSTRILARYADAETTPALVERAFGRGRVLLFTSTVDLDWNDWPRAVDGSYLVTLLETVQYAARRSEHPVEFVGGQPLTLALPLEEFEPGALFKSPRYPDEPAVVASARPPEPATAEAVVLAGPRATHLGTYFVELTSRAGRAETRPLCVNLEPGESDLAAATLSELDGALAGVPHEYLAAAEDFLRVAAQTRRELWPLVLMLLVATLVGEQTLAWWFGTPRATAAGTPPRAGPRGWWGWRSHIRTVRSAGRRTAAWQR